MGDLKKVNNAQSPFILEVEVIMIHRSNNSYSYNDNVIVQGLESASTYEVFVEAVNEYGIGEPSSRRVKRQYGINLKV